MLSPAMTAEQHQRKVGGAGLVLVKSALAHQCGWRMAEPEGVLQALERVFVARQKGNLDECS
jgi:hypothetical protein